MPKRKKQLLSHLQRVTAKIPSIFSKRYVGSILIKKLLSFGREPLLLAASNSGTIYRLSIPIPHPSRLIAFA